MTRARRAQLALGAVAIAAGVLLGSCEGNRTRVDGVFSPTSFGDNQATLVVGTAIAEYPKAFLFGTADYAAVMSVRLMFREYDPATETIKPNGHRLSLERSKECLLGGVTGGDCDLRNRVHTALNIPAGDYVLVAVELRADRIVRTTWFVQGRDREASVAGQGALRYRIAPGETAYLGDFTFDAVKFPTRLAGFARDDAAAAAAFQRVGPAGPLAFRAPTGRDARPIPEVEIVAGVDGAIAAIGAEAPPK